MMVDVDLLCVLSAKCGLTWNLRIVVVDLTIWLSQALLNLGSPVWLDPLVILGGRTAKAVA